MKVRIMVLGGLLLAALALSASAQKDKEKAKVYKTPQECFDAYVAADEKGDHKTYVACMTPEAQKDRAALVAAFSLSLRTSLKDAKDKEAREAAKTVKPVFEVLDKHGLSEKATRDIKPGTDPKESAKELKALTALIKDPAAFLVDISTAMEKAAPKPKEKDKAKKKLTGLKIDSDKATGTIVIPSRFGEIKVPVSFSKIGTSWRIFEGEGPQDKGAKKDDKDKK